MAYQVYEIVFRSGERYIGMTERSLRERLQEHRSNEHNVRLRNALAREPNPNISPLRTGLTRQGAKEEESARIREARRIYGSQLLNEA